MILLINDDSASVTAIRVTRWDRLGARLHADQTDLDLAQGRSPDSDVRHALRARALTGDRARRTLARGLQRVMTEATAPSPTLVARLPLNRARVLHALPDLDDLRLALVADGPVDPQGVALSKILLTSGSGPLRGRGRVDGVGLVARRAIEALDPTRGFHADGRVTS